MIDGTVGRLSEKDYNNCSAVNIFKRVLTSVSNVKLIEDTTA